MAELAWPDDLGHGMFIGRFGFMDADGHDPDREPDITSATGGSVTITPSIRSVRYTGTAGPMILAARAAKGVIDGLGYLRTMDANGRPGDTGMVFPATDDKDLSPTDWTYEVSIILDGSVRLPTFNVKLPEGATVDLSLAVPVSSSGGTAVVVDPSTAQRAEAAADRAETAAADAEDWSPSFDWDGTSLVIDGELGPDLEGPPGPTVEGIEDVPGLQAALPVVDTAAGTRVSIGGVDIFYNSGWRDLRDLLIPGILVPGPRSHESLRARRSIDRVEYLIRLQVGEALAGKSKSSVRPFAEGLPGGLHQEPPAYSTIGQSNQPDGVISISNSGLSSRLDISSTQPGTWVLGQTVFCYVSHNTNAALPTNPFGDPA